MTRKPHEDSKVARFIRQRVLELKPKKSQGEIAAEAGFTNPNMVTLIKTGASKLPLDRVPAMARALDCDPKRLFFLALHQDGQQSTMVAVEETFGTIVTKNKAAWISALREASDLGDPPLTARARCTLFSIFSK